MQRHVGWLTVPRSWRLSSASIACLRRVSGTMKKPPEFSLHQRCLDSDWPSQSRNSSFRPAQKRPKRLQSTANSGNGSGPRRDGRSESGLLLANGLIVPQCATQHVKNMTRLLSNGSGFSGGRMSCVSNCRDAAGLSWRPREFSCAASPRFTARQLDARGRSSPIPVTSKNTLARLQICCALSTKMYGY